MQFYFTQFDTTSYTWCVLCVLITCFIQRNITKTSKRARVKIILLPIIWRAAKISENQHLQCSKNQAQGYKCFWNLFSPYTLRVRFNQNLRGMKWEKRSQIFMAIKNLSWDLKILQYHFGLSMENTEDALKLIENIFIENT